MGQVIVHKNSPDSLGENRRVPSREEEPCLAFLNESGDAPNI